MSEEKKDPCHPCLFWGSESPFSEWYKSAPFTAKPLYGDKEIEMEFKTVQQWITYNKASCFGDQITSKKVMLSDSPRKAHDMGLRVSGFNTLKWKAVREEISIMGNYYKFKQNSNIRGKFMKHDCFVFANPSDRVWGTGLKSNDPRIMDQDQWLGTNILGQCLKEAQQRLRTEQK